MSWCVSVAGAGNLGRINFHIGNNFSLGEGGRFHRVRLRGKILNYGRTNCV
jgi:hypothetical protein